MRFWRLAVTCALAHSMCGTAARAEAGFTIAYGTYACVRNAAEEFSNIRDLIALPDDASFGIVLGGDEDHMSATIDPLPLAGFPSNPVRIANVTVRHLANSISSQSSDNVLRRTLFISGQGEDDLGRELALSDIWVGTGDTVRSFKPRISFEGMTVPVVCTLQHSEGHPQ